MKLKEKIYTAVNQMTTHELVLLYGHVKLLSEIKQVRDNKSTDIPIETILAMTSSTTCWSDAIIQEREQ
jgi:hypothetical protein